MPRSTRDRSYKFPQTVDARKNPRLWTEAVRKERAFQFCAAEPHELAEQRGGNDLRNIQQLRAKLGNMSGDYLWMVNPAPDAPLPAPAVNAGPQITTSAMAELAMGVPTAETAFLRSPVPGKPPRIASTAQHPTMLPWQHGIVDPCFVAEDALARWRAQSKLLQIPPPPGRQPRVPAEISGPHAASVDSWRRGEIPLSQWELSERGEALMAANEEMQSLSAQRARTELSKLLSVTEKASRSKAKWHER